MGYLKEFLNLEEYETYKNGADFALPNVSLVNNPYSVKYTPYTPPNYFRITNLENVSGEIYFDAIRSRSYPRDGSYPITLEYSINGDGVWTSVTDDKQIIISIPAEGYVELMGDNESMCSYINNTFLYWNLSVDFNHNLSGDIMSICGFSNTLEDYHFYKFFENNTNLIDASNLILSASTLEQHCYSGMFAGCTSLTTAPSLSVTTLATHCYNSMFANCISLTSSPKLPATTLAEGCYQSMFSDCTSLISAPELPATTLAEGCYEYMFSACTSLTTAPELPAKTLLIDCYFEMFSGCTSLNYIKAMFITTPSGTYTNNWVFNVASTGTFIKNSAATWNVTGDNGVPTGWTVQTATE